MKMLIQLLSRFLDARDRDVVVGDLIENQDRPAKALLGIAGLIVRRQAALWKDWRPLLALLGIIGIACPLLTRLSFTICEPLIREARTYMTVGVFYQSGDNTVMREILVLVFEALVLLAGSWFSGFVLALLARRTLWITGSIYLLVWTIPLPMVFMAVRQYLRKPYELTPHFRFVLATDVLFHILFFVVPSVVGMRRVRRLAPIPSRSCP